MTRLTVSAGVVVQADQERVWALALDWSRQREWIWATTVDGGQGLGAHVSGRTGIGPLGFTDPMLITHWDPPRRCTVTHLGRLVRGDGVFEVTQVADGGQPRTEFTWTERIELPLPPALGRPLAAAVIAPAARLGLGSSLRRFARLLATGLDG